MGNAVALGLHNKTPRPRHAKANVEVQEQFKKHQPCLLKIQSGVEWLRSRELDDGCTSHWAETQCAVRLEQTGRMLSGHRSSALARVVRVRLCATGVGSHVLTPDAHRIP